MPQPKSRDMRLKITGCRHVYTGINKRQDQFSIYEIDAERADDGFAIREKLRSFQALPIGRVVEVTVTPFVSERHGRSFTLALKGGRSASGTQQRNDLQEQVDVLRDSLGTLSRRVAELEGRVGTEVMQPQATSAQASSEAERDRKFGADPPDGATW